MLNSQFRTKLGWAMVSGTILFCMGYVGARHLETMPEYKEQFDPTQIQRGSLPAVGTSTETTATLSEVKVAPEDVVNINTATVDDLQSIPGIGPAMAERITTYRDAHGKFTNLMQLRSVPGIGAKTFSKIRPYLKL